MNSPLAYRHKRCEQELEGSFGPGKKERAFGGLLSRIAQGKGCLADVVKMVSECAMMAVILRVDIALGAALAEAKLLFPS